MKLSNPKWLHWQETKTLVNALAENPFRFIGGAVRDSLLGIETKDVDIATPLPPDQVMGLLTKAGIKVIPTGIDHGTVTAVIQKRNYEITTLRRDVATDGRRATIAYSDNWEEDAKRRDFTMNALYCDVQGEITDYFHGTEDALAGRVRFIGDASERIKEDALRILRFFRFSAWYGREEADKEALAACAFHAQKINTLSGERIQQEMLKLLTAEKSSSVIALMREHAILHYAIPGKLSVTSLSRLPALLHKSGQPADPILALSLLLRSSEPPVSELTGYVSQRWKLSKAYQRMLEALCNHHWKEPAHKEKHWKKQVRTLGKELFIKQMLLQMAEGYDESIGLQIIEDASQWDIPEFPVTGDDLVRSGMKPGKGLGAMLAQLEQHWEEHDHKLSKEELLGILAKHKNS
jgi:poly(A) polymerase